MGFPECFCPLQLIRELIPYDCRYSTISLNSRPHITQYLIPFELQKIATMSRTTVAELARQVEDMHMDDAASESSDEDDLPTGRSDHILHFEFPATELLPGYSNLPYLPRPTSLSKRAKPSQDSFHDGLGTDFFVAMNAYRLPFVVGSTIGPQEIAQRLINAVRENARFLGSSRLKMVAYNSSRSTEDIKYRFQLTTTRQTPSWFPPSNPVQEFELDSIDFARLIANPAGRIWTHVLCDLYYRESDRAYFEVDRQLSRRISHHQSFSAPWAWNNEWDSVPTPSTEELFMDRLKPITQEDKVALYEAGDRDVNFRLPCGHRIYVRKIKILAMNEEGCLTYQCPTCSGRVMQRQDDNTLRSGKDLDRAFKFTVQHATWKPLDHSTLWHLPWKFHTRTLLEALDLALTSFKAPHLICPDALCPTVLFHPETTMIIQRFGWVYG